MQSSIVNRQSSIVKNSVKTFACLSSVALLLTTHTSFAAITIGKPTDISPEYFTIAVNGSNCDITGVWNSTTNLGSGVATNGSTYGSTYCVGDGTSIGSNTPDCNFADTDNVVPITKPTTTLNVGVLYFKNISGSWKRYPGWFTLDSNCSASNFYYDNELESTILIGQTPTVTFTPVSVPSGLNLNDQVEIFATEIEQ